jgi:hypothetical protein
MRSHRAGAKRRVRFDLRRGAMAYHIRGRWPARQPPKSFSLRSDPPLSSVGCSMLRSLSVGP